MVSNERPITLLAFKENRLYPADIVYVKTLEELLDNRWFLEVLNERGMAVSTDDFRVAKLIDSNINASIFVYLMDDMDNKSRSYIDIDSFLKVHLVIPLSYVMWDVSFSDYCYVYGSVYTVCGAKVGLLYANEEGIVRKSEILEVQRVSRMIASLKYIDDIDKVLIVSNYLQRYTQYVEGRVTKLDGKCYVTPYLTNEEINRVGYLRSVLFLGYGVCVAIASATVLMLNNPILGVDVRRVGNCQHAWNVCKIAGSNYFVDNSRAITRSDNLCSEFIKNKEINLSYLLFGTLDNLADLEYYENYQIAKSGISWTRKQAHLSWINELGLASTYPSVPMVLGYLKRY